MLLKKDDNGNVILVEDKPIYVHADGQEIPFDAPAATEKITDLNKECAKHRHAAKEANEKLDSFSEYTPEMLQRVDDIKDLDIEAAKQAMETISNLKDGDLVRAGQVETLKAEMNRAFESKESEINTSWKKRFKILEDTNMSKDTTIYNLMVSSRFASSPTILEKTILPPDIAANYFSKNFQVEGEGDSACVIGYLNGNKIFSKEKPGEIADFEEALNVVIENYPMKDRILKATAGGSGSGGNTNTNRGEEREFLASLPPSERLKHLHRIESKK